MQATATAQDARKKPHAVYKDTAMQDTMPGPNRQGPSMKNAAAQRMLGKADSQGAEARQPNQGGGEYTLPEAVVSALGGPEALDALVAKITGSAGGMPMDGPPVPEDAAARMTGMVSGPGTATSDSIPAQLSDGEYVLPAKTVDVVGEEALDETVRATTGQEPGGKLIPKKSVPGFSAGGKAANWMRGVGDYWKGDNDKFEAKNPGMVDRVMRTMNPMTGLGSALGEARRASINKDPAGLAIAAASGIPAFAATKMLPAAKTLAGYMPAQVGVDSARSAVGIGANAAVGVGGDLYSPNGPSVMANYKPPVQQPTQAPQAAPPAPPAVSRMANYIPSQPQSPQPNPGYDRNKPPMAVGFSKGGSVAADDIARRVRDSANASLEAQRSSATARMAGEATRATASPSAGSAPPAAQPARPVPNAAPNGISVREATMNEFRSAQAAQQGAPAQQAQAAPRAAPAPAPASSAPASLSPRSEAAGRMLGRATSTVAKLAGKTAVTAPLAGFGDYKINEPGVDSSASGVAANLLSGNFSDAWKGTKKGAVEAGLDSMSGIAKAGDFVAGMVGADPQLAQQLDTRVRSDLGGFLVPQEGQPTPQQAAPVPATDAAASAPPTGPGVPPATPVAPPEAQQPEAQQPSSVAPTPNQPQQGPAIDMMVQKTAVPGVSRIDNAPGLNSPLFTNLPAGEAVSGMRGGTVSSIDMRANNEAMARANAISKDMQRIRQNRLDGRPDDWKPNRQERNTDKDSMLYDARKAMEAADSARFHGRPGEAKALDRRAEVLMGAAMGYTEEQGENTRAGMVKDVGMKNADTASTEAEARMVSIRGEQEDQDRMRKLREQFMAEEDPEKKKSLGESLLTMMGKTQEQNKIAVVPGGQEWDPVAGAMRTLPSVAINTQTGEPINLGERESAPPTLPPRDQLEAGKVYQTARGPARWDGKQFIPERS